jgi:hypothetical protein
MRLLRFFSKEMWWLSRRSMRPWMVLENSKGHRPCTLLEAPLSAPTSIRYGFSLNDFRLTLSPRLLLFSAI